VQLLQDGQRFVQHFQVPIRLSALHVYYSALPFTPKDTVFYHTFSDQSQDTMQVLSGTDFSWTNCLEILEGHINQVMSVAFSPDGNKVVSGSSDRTLRIWDVFTGDEICAPLEGHSDIVMSVTFSPDGSKVVSGSSDMTVRIWDVFTGAQISVPLEGHSDTVMSVTISLDGSKIVSGSSDRTLCIWDIFTGDRIGAPLEGHSDIVMSVDVCGLLP
jgi:WD40 repeat protein